MTILVGIKCTNGIVIGADSAATFAAGQIRTIEQQTDKISIVGGSVIVAGTGQVGLGQRFTQIVEKTWEEKKFSGTPVDVGKYLCSITRKDFSETGVEEEGEYIKFESEKVATITGSISEKNASFIRSHLVEEQLINIVPNKGIALTFEGWQFYDELKKDAINSKKAFMAMKFGDTELNSMYEDHFKAAVKQTGFYLVSLQDPGKQKSGLIDSHLEVEIRTSRFLVVDLTHGNQGAYWEAGFAAGLGKPVIYTCSKQAWEDKKKRHFDTEHHQTVKWDLTDPEKSTTRLKDIIRATLPSEAKLAD